MEKYCLVWLVNFAVSFGMGILFQCLLQVNGMLIGAFRIQQVLCPRTRYCSVTARGVYRAPLSAGIIYLPSAMPHTSSESPPQTSPPLSRRVLQDFLWNYSLNADLRQNDGDVRCLRACCARKEARHVNTSIWDPEVTCGRPLNCVRLIAFERTNYTYIFWGSLWRQ